MVCSSPVASQTDLPTFSNCLWGVGSRGGEEDGAGDRKPMRRLSPFPCGQREEWKGSAPLEAPLGSGC